MLKKKDLGPNRNAVLAGAKEAFFKAMLNGGYAGDHGIKIPVGLRVNTDKLAWNTKITTRVGDDFQVIDEWWATPYSDCSGGSTVILYRDGLFWHPIWWMSYHGKYSVEVIPFLKAALADAYTKGLFIGGRGQNEYRNSALVYRNHMLTADFAGFEGREEIRDAEVSGNSHGFHQYAGGSFI